jgi:hypothetical protein
MNNIVIDNKQNLQIQQCLQLKNNQFAKSLRTLEMAQPRMEKRWLN